MEAFLADTNFLLRHILNDIPAQAFFAEKRLQKAKKGLIRIIVCPVVLFEMAYALEKFYKLSPAKTTDYLRKIVTTPYLEVEERGVLLDALTLHREGQTDFVDAYLFAKAQAQAVEVLSFDKDFQKLKKQRISEEVE